MMVILALSNRKNNEGQKARIYCSWRNRYVAALPEEVVRMQLLKQMVEALGYPKHYIAVERELTAFVQQTDASQKLPLRRADIVCLTTELNTNGELLPLLLIECKAVVLTRKMQDQVVGYNHYLKAPFVALVNHLEARTGWFEPQEGAYKFVAGLPSYGQLLALARRIYA